MSPAAGESSNRQNDIDQTGQILPYQEGQSNEPLLRRLGLLTQMRTSELQRVDEVADCFAVVLPVCSRKTGWIP